MKPMMKQSNSHGARLLVGACTLLMILSAAQAGFAQQAAQAQPRPNQQVAPAQTAAPVAARPAAKPAGEAEKAPTPSKPGSEGIKIHGHWVLVVKNPDGKVVERREFDNSLVTTFQGSGYITGDQIITALLSGNATLGDPEIVFVSNLGGVTAGTCFQTAVCDFFYTGSNSFFAPGHNNNNFGNQYLTFESGLNITTNFSPAVSWVLTGGYTVLSNGSKSISGVGTMTSLCVSNASSFATSILDYSSPQGSFADRSADIGSKSCDANDIPSTDHPWIGGLTYTVIPGGPLAVVTGQVIQVTVTISFA